MLSALLAASMVIGAAPPSPPVTIPNAGFELDADGDGLPDGWIVSEHGNPGASIRLDAVAHTGGRSVRLQRTAAARPYVWAGIQSGRVALEPESTYVLRIWAKGRGVADAFVALSIEGGPEQRMTLPRGDFEWRECSAMFSTPPGCTGARIGVFCDDAAASLWIDDAAIEVARRSFTRLRLSSESKPFAGVLPQSSAAVAKQLVVLDTGALSREEKIAAAALQGMVNRSSPRVYLLYPSEPAGVDAEYLEWMRRRGHTGPSRRVATLAELIGLFRGEIAGAIVYDPDLPGSIHAACMLGGLRSALPLSPALAKQLGLGVVDDLRGRWRRNVDAYRYVFDRHWPRMCHRVLAWRHPHSASCTLDYQTQHNVFVFWVSSYGDTLPGADPAAEEQFLHELLAATPANVPVMGWPSHGDVEGVPEHQGVRVLSEYGKFVPGTEFCTNLSVHTAIRLPEGVLRRKPPARRPPSLARDKVYITLSVLESGDALWYWQSYQRKAWADSARGSVPIGWCMTPLLSEALPLVAQWYFEQATENDTFFAAPSGLGYMNAATYASRFAPNAREAVWRQYVQWTDDRRRRLGLEGVELYTDGLDPPRLAPILQRFTTPESRLDYILADFTRFDTIRPDNANYMLGDTVVFHTLTRYHTWLRSDELRGRDRDKEIAYLLEEIRTHTPTARAAFISAMVTSWTFTPSWVERLARQLPRDYVVVSVPEMAGLYRQSVRVQPAGGARQP